MPATGSTPRGRIVGLGASAGGLEALEQFLARVPPASGLAFIVVQHLDPTHKAMLTELLQRSTSLTVREAVTAAAIEADTVYVIPPNAELTVAHGQLQLASPTQPRGLRLPIDVLFSSLARDQGDRAIGVVLSGMGSDGTVGLQAIKGQGGLTLAQDPATAQFDSMPRNAIASGACDIVAPAPELPARILAVTRQGSTARPTATEEEEDAAALETILGLLRQRSKHDLGLYKSSTLRRRIERRLGVHGLGSLADYAAFVRENPQELDILFKEVLIGVTQFFRDPAVWLDLKQRVLPALLARCAPRTTLRAWVAGCSTGEEAYSLALAFREVADSQSAPEAWNLQVFATDLNADAIAAARTGSFARNIAAEVDARRLARFFSIDGERYLISKEIRQMVLFAQHDMILDPPFTRLDLLCCRNVLIYFNAALQQRLLPLFHYALLPGGVLMLGGSETIGRSTALFSSLNSQAKLYLRTGTAAVGQVDFPVKRKPASPTGAQEPPVSHSPSRAASLQSVAEQVLLQEFAPPAVLVNDVGDIVFISGHTGRYLEPAAGKANWNIHVMARPAIRLQVAGAIRQAVEQGKPVDVRGLRLEQDGVTTLDVKVHPLRDLPLLEGMVMVVFHETADPPRTKTRRRGGTAVTSADAQLSAELARARAEIHTLREEMTASREELQSANEELQSTNEELQSANEELTSSKEESQSMNEELQTINAELHSKLDDLAMAQSDMQNLLNSTDIATLFLDNALNVRRFTEHISRIVPLREADVGRPLSDLASTLIYPELHADATETLRTLAFCEKSIATTDGRWYTVRIMPYRTVANVIQGVVITFIDITAAKELESRLRKSG